MTMRHCSFCAKPLSAVNVTGRCRRHGNLWRADEQKSAAAKAKFRASLCSDPFLVDRLRLASAARLAWCPPEYRDEYRRLTRAKMLPAAEAKAIILDLIDAHAERYRRTGQLQQVTK